MKGVAKWSSLGSKKDDVDNVAAVNAEVEASADIIGIAKREKDEDARRAMATDTEFFVCVVFSDRAAKEEFLANAKLSDLGDKYINGHEMARRLGVKVADPAKLGKGRKPGTRWTSLG